MLKGKLKSPQKKYTPVILVPGFSNRLRLFCFRPHFGAVIIVFVLLAGLFAGSYYNWQETSKENAALKASISELYNANSEQRKLLASKAEELEIQKDQNVGYSAQIDEKISEFTTKFNELTDKYIASSKTSRSGERTAMTFSDELTGLKDILVGLNELNDRHGALDIDLAESEQKLADFFETIPTIWPASGKISDDYGYRIHPITGRRTFHEGIDINGNYGDNILAAAAGTVIKSEYDSGYGKTIIIDHGRGLSTVYAHASSLLVSVGDKVSKGDLIAKVGSTGASTGSHLHFEVLLYGAHTNPLQYLE